MAVAIVSTRSACLALQVCALRLLQTLTPLRPNDRILVHRAYFAQTATYACP